MRDRTTIDTRDTSDMELTFYDAPYSTAIITVAVLAELEHGEAKRLAERVNVDIQNGGSRTKEYLDKVNPNGRVPAIVHKGVAIWESAAITMYLGEIFGETRGLYPALGPSRGEAMKWIVWTNTVVAEAASRLLATMKDPATLSDIEKLTQGEQADKARADIRGYLRILNEALEISDYLLKEGYSLADTHVWSLMSYVQVLKVDFEPYAEVKAWMKKIGQRPAQKSVQG